MSRVWTTLVVTQWAKKAQKVVSDSEESDHRNFRPRGKDHAPGRLLFNVALGATQRDGLCLKVFRKQAKKHAAAEDMSPRRRFPPRGGGGDTPRATRRCWHEIVDGIDARRNPSKADLGILINCRLWDEGRTSAIMGSGAPETCWEE
uniref:Uncharacterized protein n=1 Tax=Steinernema glaseri TaxID=37863 RepID=A0A1I7Y5G4_9BILA